MNEKKNIITQDDLDMSGNILSILKCQKVYLMSWGFESPVVIKQGLRFKVNGFQHQGWIEIRYNEGADLFDVYLVNDDNTLKDLKEGIYFDELVDTIDLEVERVENYNERVNQEYNIINNDEKNI